MLSWLACCIAPRLAHLEEIEAPPLAEPAFAPDLAQRGVEALAAAAAVPFEPAARHSPGRLLLGMGCVDIVTREADQHPDTAGRTPNYAAYPPFQEVEVPGADGSMLTGHHSVGAPGAPIVFVIHGLNDSHVTHYVVDYAEVLRRWGFHVFSLDLRDHGRLRGRSGPMSMGIHEGRDLFAAAQAVSHDEGVSVGMLGISYGGQCAVRAAHEATLAGEADVLRGGVITMCAPLDIHEAVLSLDDNTRLPRPDRLGDRLVMRGILSMFRRSLRLRSIERLPGKQPCSDYEDFIRRVVLPAYPEQPGLVGAYLGGARSTHAKVLAELAVPTLILHAEDDPLVPVAHALKAREAAGDNPLVTVRSVPRGGHVALAHEDPAGTLGILSAFFGRLRDG